MLACCNVDFYGVFRIIWSEFFAKEKNYLELFRKWHLAVSLMQLHKYC